MNLSIQPHLPFDRAREGVLMTIRWFAVVFACFQILSFYKPYPQHVEALALAGVGLYALCLGVLTLWWRRWREEGTAPQGFGIIALVLDGFLAQVLVWLYAFDVETAIFIILYIVLLEAAFRYGLRGALWAWFILTALYMAREAYADLVFGHPFLAVSISFRMGIGLMIAVVGGAMADRFAQANEMLRQAVKQEHEAAEAMENLAQLRAMFLAAASHELRTPLTSIMGFAITINDQAQELSARTRALFQNITEQSKELERLLDDLRDVEQLGRGIVALNKADCDVGQLVSQIVRSLPGDQRPRVEIDMRAERSVQADPAKIRRIIESLLANALRYSPADSPVRLCVCEQERGLMLCVDDAGPGVPEQFKEQIFKPFERGELVHDAHPGTGIGLALVEQYTHLHGGRTWVQTPSVLGGASFRVLIPYE